MGTRASSATTAQNCQVPGGWSRPLNPAMMIIAAEPTVEWIAIITGTGTRPGCTRRRSRNVANTRPATAAAINR
nr:hypothetical protein [Naumannella halotolerans]